MRGTLLLIALTAELLATAPAHAQTTPPTTQWAAADFLIRVRKRDGEKWIYIPENEAKLEFFNNARCECEEPVQITVDLSSSGVAKKGLITEGNVRMLVGPLACVAESSTDRNNAGCVDLGQKRLGDVGSNGWIVETTVKKLFQRKDGTGCNDQFDQIVWLWLSTNNNVAPDLTDTNAPRLTVQLDGQPLPAPTDVRVTSGNEALNVTWTRQMGLSDFNGFVVFCARGGTEAVFNPSFYDGRQYFSPAIVCPNGPGTSTPLVTFADTGDAQGGSPVSPPDAFRTLDPAYTCSGLLTTADEARISILQNKIPYVVGVTIVDKHGNASPIETAFLQTPIPTRDFYQGYRQAGGTAEGGYCAYGGGRPGVAALAAAAFAFALVRRRRR